MALLKILVADDNKLLLTMTKDVLEEAGFEVPFGGRDDTGLETVAGEKVLIWVTYGCGVSGCRHGKTG